MRLQVTLCTLALLASGSVAWAATASTPAPIAPKGEQATPSISASPLNNGKNSVVTPSASPTAMASAKPTSTATAAPLASSMPSTSIQPNNAAAEKHISVDESKALPTAPPSEMLESQVLAKTIIRHKTLADGLQVYVVEDHAAPVVQTAMWYRFGALYEVPGKTGLAHGLEHMMFRGTPSLSEGGLDDIMAHEGAQINANTSNDYTHFYTVLPSSRSELAIRLEADRMRNLLLRNPDWQLEKGAVLNEYDGDLGSPTTLLYYDVCLRATPAPLCGLSALGVRADIVRSTADTLRGYYDKYYYPNNATLVVVGDVHASKVFAIAEAAFANVPRRAVPVAKHLAPKLSSNQRLVEHGDTPYATVDIAYPSVGDLDPKAGTAAVLDGVLANPRSPLYDALVVSGITLGYETSLSSNLAGGLEHVFMTVAPSHTPQDAENAFHTALDSILKTGVAPSLVEAAKRAALVNAISARDAVDSLGDRIGYPVGVEQRDPSVDDNLIARTTVTDVNAFARATFMQPSVTGTLLPRRPKPGSVSDGGGSVADSFSGRAPSGPIVIAPWVHNLISKPLNISSRIHPTDFRLSNGIRVLVQPVHENPTVFIQGQIEGSPLLEPVDKIGVRDMTSQLLGYGGERYDFIQQHVLADRLGASLSFGEDFSAHGLSQDLPTLLDALADGQLHPTFPSKYVDLVRNQTLADIDARDRDPDELASRRLELLVLPAGDVNLHRPTKQTVQHLDRADFVHYLAHAYRPDLTTITVVGDVTPEQVRTQLERTFGAWSAVGARPNLAMHLVPQPKPATAHVLAARRLISVTIAQPTIPRKNKDFVTMNLINEILGGGGTFDTRLMHQLREQRGLVYSASSSLEVGKYRGVLVMNLSTPPEHAKQAIALAEAQLRAFLVKPPTQEELDRARERLVSSSLVAEQSTSVISSHVATIGRFNLPLDYYHKLSSTYQKVTPQDILAVARRQLHPNNLVVVTEGPAMTK